jgi:GAF domain-containing protein
VVDCFDALTSDRPYRPRMDDDEALAILRQRSGNMYDPAVVEAFFAMYADHMALQETSAVATAPIPVAAAQSPSTPPAPAMTGHSDVLEMFYRLGAEITATMRTQELGRIVWHHLQPHVPACSFVLFAYDSDSNTLLPQFRSDDRVVAADTQVAVGERLSGWVAANGRSIVNSDARLDQDEAQRETTPLGSALAVPVIGDGRVIAVLGFYAEQGDAFTPSHRETAEAAARAITVVPVETPTLAVNAA